MSLYITIDGGTTNTRVNIVKDRSLLDTVRLDVGARRGIDDKELYKSEIKRGIEQILKKNSLKEEDIVSIIASGMITSEFGLVCLEHINAPAGIGELHNTMARVSLPEISKIPFAFIRGVKLFSDSFDEFDVMRGEETELMGILGEDFGECIYILPGSHSKVISVDKWGKITDFSTMMTGEMVTSLSQNTILKDAVELGSSEINSEYLLCGYEYALKEGLNKALFKTRIFKSFFGCGRDEAYSFFLGAVLSGEITEIKKSKAKTVVIGGRRQIKEAMSLLLKAKDTKTVVTLDDSTVNSSTAIGAVRIFEYSTVS